MPGKWRRRRHRDNDLQAAIGRRPGVFEHPLRRAMRGNDSRFERYPELLEHLCRDASSSANRKSEPMIRPTTGGLSWASFVSVVLIRWSDEAKEKSDRRLSGPLFNQDTEGGTRTHTPLRAPDFESGASAIPPLRPVSTKTIIPQSVPMSTFRRIGNSPERGHFREFVSGSHQSSSLSGRSPRRSCRSRR